MQRRKWISVLLVLLMGCLLPGWTKAATDNTLVIHKIAGTQEIKDLHVVPVEGSEPVAGAVYRIWRIGEIDRTTDQGAYDRLLAQLNTNTVRQLDAQYSAPPPRSSEPTDAEGTTTFSGLADGRYYVREVHPDTGLDVTNGGSVPFIIDLPYATDEGTQQVVEVYPKTEPPPDEDDPLGGERFRKVDDTGEGLRDARFKVMRQKTDDAGDPIVDAGGNLIYEPFLREGKEVILAADVTGRFEIKGLTYGTYWLVETVSPSGYSLLTQPVAFEIDALSYEDDTILRIINSKRPPPPPPREPDTPGTPEEPQPPEPTPPDLVERPGSPESPDTPPPGAPGTQTPPPSGSTSSSGSKPPVTIPKTGDPQTYLILFSGLALVLTGSWLIRSSKA